MDGWMDGWMNGFDSYAFGSAATKGPSQELFIGSITHGTLTFISSHRLVYYFFFV
ncbi:hypothetical protein B0F90DRAFT_1757772 [Multifurca ochricompacta]|uniref:Uncharacterized protein n=1 Tax=Multifurca ochricompacta TaxID=376703 RepID=A0AAD4LY82_9AGAM|nr:hypothetical protein B0F90DRAFT_1757772 [Multifurca ochricompacta]